ncbi:hypothetical protein ON010_g11464 [Phytophthora cinnamomi]|nr:hypothetical protein ON010_g11464 [Phytophthora cinnamomi]
MDQPMVVVMAKTMQLQAQCYDAMCRLPGASTKVFDMASQGAGNPRRVLRATITSTNKTELELLHKQFQRLALEQQKPAIEIIPEFKTLFNQEPRTSSTKMVVGVHFQFARGNNSEGESRNHDPFGRHLDRRSGID